MRDIEKIRLLIFTQFCANLGSAQKCTKVSTFQGKTVQTAKKMRYLDKKLFPILGTYFCPVLYLALYLSAHGGGGLPTGILSIDSIITQDY